MTEDLFQQLIDYANQCIAYHARDTAHMKNFLRFLARLKTHNVSVANKVLICGYSPNALDVRTEEDWTMAGVHVIHPERMIHNLYRPDKGNYTDRIMYDITATDGVYVPFPKYKEPGQLAERLLLGPPCPIVFLENHQDGKGKAEYIPDKQIVEVTRGFTNELEVCHLLLREYAHYFLHGKKLSQEANRKKVPVEQLEKTFRYDRRAYGVNAYSVAYTIALRFGLKEPELDNIHPASGLKPMDLLDIFDELDFAIEKLSDQVIRGPYLKKLADAKAKDEKEKAEAEAKKKKEEEKKKKEEVDLGPAPVPPDLGR